MRQSPQDYTISELKRVWQKSKGKDDFLTFCSHAQLMLANAEAMGKKTSLQFQNNLFGVPESDRPDSASRATKVRLNIICFPWFLVSGVVFHIIYLSTVLKYSFYPSLHRSLEHAWRCALNSKHHSSGSSTLHSYPGTPSVGTDGDRAPYRIQY